MMNGYCYLYKDPYENPLNWTAAFKECQTFGASLLVIDDSREQEVIKKQLWDGAYWIGYNRTDTNAYKDVFGAYLPQNVIWAPEQLNKGYGNENCVSLTRIEQGAKRGELRSNYCGNKSGFICKMKGNSFQSPITLKPL